MQYSHLILNSIRHTKELSWRFEYDLKRETFNDESWIMYVCAFAIIRPHIK